MCVVTKLAAESSVQQAWCGRVSLLPSFGGTDAKVAAVTTLAYPSPCLFVTRARLALAASYQLDLTMYMGKQIVIEISVFNGSLTICRIGRMFKTYMMRLGEVRSCWHLLFDAAGVAKPSQLDFFLSEMAYTTLASIATDEELCSRGAAYCRARLVVRILFCSGSRYYYA